MGNGRVEEWCYGRTDRSGGGAVEANSLGILNSTPAIS